MFLFDALVNSVLCYASEVLGFNDCVNIDKNTLIYVIYVKLL